MATYVIGDIQGCFDELQVLLKEIKYSAKDQLWFAGDLVNRGPKSLETLRFIKSLGKRAKVVLGNHDLHLLAVYYTSAKLKRQDTLSDVLAADDCDELMHWLKSQPLAHYDPTLNALMSHAGIPFDWSTEQVLSRANEVSNMLQSPRFRSYFKEMYGNKPDRWDEKLNGMDRLRCITNYLTRMRFCSPKQRLDLNFKGQIGSQPDNLHPWFELYPHSTDKPLILFGHWAALMGNTGRDDILALDTGCVWGEKMTAFCLESKRYFYATSNQ